MNKYRLYIDETGNPDLASSEKTNHRFLSLTGVAIELNYIDTVIFFELENIKRKYFKSHPDEPVVLHRKDMLQQRHPFEPLGDKKTRNKFDEELLTLLTKWEYTVFTVLIDKLEHKQKYTTWQFDPYHYCMMILIERYVLFLEDNQSGGDVMAESRGGKEDIRLKDSYTRLLQTGAEYLGADRFTRFLTSKQLKVKPKANNIAGLQIADLIAHPSRREILINENLIDDKRENLFSDEIIKVLQVKYYQKFGRINGYGKKKLP